MDEDGSYGSNNIDSIPVDSSAAFYGKGIFTTIAIRHSQLLFWEKHYRRLSNDLDAIGLPPISEQETITELTKFLNANGIVNGRARITIFDATSAPVWHKRARPEVRSHIICADIRPKPQRFRICLSPYPVNSLSPLAGIKSCNYLENLLAIDEAKHRGSDEAVRLNERGEVTGGCMSNVFWLNNDGLFTPSLQTGCLPGTTREYVLERVACKEVQAGIEELRAADSIFLTSAGLGIVEVDEFDGRTLTKLDHPIKSLWPPS